MDCKSSVSHRMRNRVSRNSEGCGNSLGGKGSQKYVEHQNQNGKAIEKNIEGPVSLHGGCMMSMAPRLPSIGKVGN